MANTTETFGGTSFDTFSVKKYLMLSQIVKSSHRKRMANTTGTETVRGTFDAFSV